MRLEVCEARIVDWEVPLGETGLIVVTGNTRREFTCRQGSYLILHADVGSACSEEMDTVVGMGEIVEPVFTRADEHPKNILRESREILAGLKKELIGLVLTDNWIDAIRRFVTRSSTASCMSDRLASFCVEQALLTLVAHFRDIPLWEILRQYLGLPLSELSMQSPVLRLNSMFNIRNGSDTLNKVPRGVVKLKVGGDNTTPQLDAERVNFVAEKLTQKEVNILRLDANQAWSLEEYNTFITHLTDRSRQVIEYIEEPFRISCLEELSACLKSAPKAIPIALDESLLLSGIPDVLEYNPTIPIVNKVFLHGIASAPSLFLTPSRTTITCTFESGLGLAFLVSLAYAVNPTQYHGLYPLLSMAQNSSITDQFLKLIQHDDLGFFVDVHATESLLRNQF